MSNDITARPTQTKVKHIILEGYISAWGGILVNSLRRRAQTARTNGKRFELHLVYVDCNAYRGRYAGELEDRALRREPPVIWGSPIVGIRALDTLAIWAHEKAGVEVRTSAILIEQHGPSYKDLKTSLEMAGLTSRTRETTSFETIRDGEIALVRGDSTTMADQLIAYTQAGTKFSIFNLDPYGPKGIPLSFVKPIISKPRQDVIINMPYQDLHKKAGLITKPHLSEIELDLLDNYDAMFGQTGWRSIVHDLDTDALWEEIGLPPGFEPPEDLARILAARKREEELRQSYWETLQSYDPDLAVKSIGLRFPDKERTMFYLYLTTHDPSGALAMNKVLYDAGLTERELRTRLKEATKLKGWTQGSFATMSDGGVATGTPGTRPSKEEIAEQIAERLGGGAFTRRNIYRAFGDDTYFANEIDNALRSMNGKLAFYEGKLTNDTVIRILNA